jgi:hypothetical protein
VTVYKVAQAKYKVGQVFRYEVWTVLRGSGVLIFCSIYRGFYSEKVQDKNGSAVSWSQVRNKGISEIG